MPLRIRPAVLAAALLLPAAAHAQVSVTLGSGGVTSAVPSPVALTGNNATLQVTCAPPLSCTTVTATVVSSAGSTPAAPGLSTAAAATFTLNASQLGGQTTGTLQFSAGGAAIGSVPVTAAAGPVRQDTVVSVGSSLGELLTADCTAELARWQDQPTYSGAENLAQFVVTPIGNVVFRPGDVVDENDVVRVVVVGASEVVSRLKVQRQSAFRTPGVLNVLGQGSTLPFNFKGALTCASGAFLVADLAPGQGQVQMSMVQDDGTAQPVGSFDFGVNTLYAGAFALGAIRTELRDPTFGVSVVGADSVLTETADGTPRVLYLLSYTPFLWGPRDVSKSVPAYQHLNPFFGVVLNDIANNAVMGVSLDLESSVYLQAGVHAGRVTRLDPRSGLRLGDAFSGGASAVPTVTEWDWDWFVGASLDLRVAVQLLQAALSGGNGGGGGGS